MMRDAMKSAWWGAISALCNLVLILYAGTMMAYMIFVNRGYQPPPRVMLLWVLVAVVNTSSRKR